MRIFSPYGRVESIRHFQERDYAFVIFADLQSATQARTLLNQRPAELFGRTISVNFGKQPLSVYHGAHVASAQPLSSPSSSGAPAAAPNAPGPHSFAAVAGAASAGAAAAASTPATVATSSAAPAGGSSSSPIPHTGDSA